MKAAIDMLALEFDPARFRLIPFLSTMTASMRTLKAGAM